MIVSFYQGPANFFCKGERVNILGFADLTVFVTTLNSTAVAQKHPETVNK